MDLGRIKTLIEEAQTGDLGMSELVEIQEAFDALVKSGVELRDEFDNALTLDMLSELEDHATTVEKVIYEWVVENFGEAEANDPSWSTSQLANRINQIPVILGAEDSKLGFLLGETK